MKKLIEPPAVIVLAAGKGTRMKSNRAKVLHSLFYRPMVHHVMETVKPLQPRPTVVVVGHQRQEVEAVLAGFEVSFAIQARQDGTGHAVACARESLADFDGVVMILYGDVPLLEHTELSRMLAHHHAHYALLTIMTTTPADPTGYGRILRDESGQVVRIVEEKDATAEQRLIGEINAGIYCVDKGFLFSALERITADNSQGELYLTDIVEIAIKDELTVATYEHPQPLHALGINSRAELAAAEALLRARRNQSLMQEGVTIFEPATTSVDPRARIEADCVLGAGVQVTGASHLGRGCRLEPGVLVHESIIGKNAQLGAYSVIRSPKIAEHAPIEPLTYLGNPQKNKPPYTSQPNAGS